MDTPKSRLIHCVGSPIVLTTGFRKKSRSLDVAGLQVDLYGGASTRSEIVVSVITTNPDKGNREATTRLSLTREVASELAKALIVFAGMPPWGDGQ